MAERQIGHRKSSLVISTRFPIVKWCSRSVAKSAETGNRARKACGTQGNPTNTAMFVCSQKSVAL